MFRLPGKVIGITLLVLGVVLLVFGYQEYNAFTSKLGRAFGAAPSNKVMLMLIGGAISGILGFLQILRK
ncbi:MAG: DUF3185 family protein [Nitrospirota bacterium]|nr:MAG: DUF3185 family protein [Nitrospirota bacterium]